MSDGKAVSTPIRSGTGFFLTLLLAPKFRGGRHDHAAFVTKAGLAIARQKERAVEIDEIGALGEEDGRRHGQ